MKITNEKFKALFKSLSPNNSGFFQNELLNQQPLNFIEVNGCVLLRGDNKVPELNMDFIFRQFGDRSGFEAVDSHLHMIDVSNKFVEHPFEGLNFAIHLLNKWSLKLKAEFSNYEFVIYLTFHDDDTIIRFHRLRADESTWMDINKIDEYMDEGIMICIV
ncbi:hypothetical protein ACFO9Q_10180 [Paenibacillus sp. GCM10023252]|uniref:hypothetical protein n=1 Tax=Paenibacillus sp. GCM10023252 TaxID=3252649 RepID=UPI00362172EB